MMADPFSSPPDADRRRDDGLRAVVAAHRPLVAATCARYLGRDVDDAVQETFLRLLRHGAGQPIESLPAWLTRVAQTVCLDALRRRGSERRRVEGASIVLPGDRPGPASARRHAEIEAKLALAMRRLTESDQRLIAERFVGEVPLRAIAARTGESIATVSRRASRAIRQLAEALRDLGVAGSDEHLLAEHFADPAYALSRDASEPDSPLRVARDRRALEASIRHSAFAPTADDDAPAIVGPLMPGWTRPIRVGAFAGHRSLLAAGRVGSRIGGGEAQVGSTGLLADPRFELVAIVEPDTTHLGPIERTIRDFELFGGLIEATDVASLATLDVILLGINYAIGMNVVAAVRAAVRDHGVGLLKESWLGSLHVPTLPDEAGDLMLAGSRIFAYHMPGHCRHEVDAVVCRSSPLIGDLADGTRLRVNGCGAVYAPAAGTTVLIARAQAHAESVHGLKGFGTLPSPVMLTGTVGLGRAVVFNDVTHTRLAARGTFGPDHLPRLIAWLAEPRREADGPCASLLGATDEYPHPC